MSTKLYRITVITPSLNIERGVWAEHLTADEHSLVFKDENFDEIARYPINYTMITSIETKEDYDKRKSSI